MVKKALKWTGVGLGVVAALLGVFVGYAIYAANARADQRYRVPAYALEVPSDAASLAEGERLYHARGCAECHGEDGAGRVMIDAPPLLLAPPNITVVGASMSPSDWHGLVRHGVYGDGSTAFFMPAHEYARMPDRELGALIAYVRTLAPREATHPPSELRPLGKVLLTLGVLDTMYPAERIDHAAPLDPAPEPSPTAAFGSYLTESCRGCHGEHLSGGPIPGAPEDQTGVPTNLTMHETGLRAWSVETFKSALRTGRRPDGSEINPRFMPWRSMHSHMTDTELEAMWAYLQTVEPRPEGSR
jgi:mono/diheme cytochrome c family protein